jgi:protoporphyrin/coproporphyrin ferrochelatase
MSKRIGILVAQLGTPDAPTTASVRTYLRQFLSDRRVVDLNRAIWLPILHGIVLNTRPAKSAELYRNVWTADGSPLMHITRRQAAGLQDRLSTNGVEFRAEVAMRYGNPSTRSAIAKLIEWGAERILLFPMYPQYSAATTGSTYDEVFDELKRLRFIPALRVVPPYFQDASYIDVLAQSVRDRMAPLAKKPDRILLSFHGIPQRYATLGDPYPEQCMATARSLAAAMGWTNDDYTVTFQSRFGREPWLQPYTDETLMTLGREGLKDVLVLCPGFTADCLETIDEIANLGHEQFRGAGGGSLHLVECVNDRADWLDAMTAIASRELAGWI